MITAAVDKNSRAIRGLKHEATRFHEIERRIWRGGPRGQPGAALATRAQAKMVLKASNVQPAGGISDRGGDRKSGQEARSRRNGRLSVQMYPSMQLGSEKDHQSRPRSARSAGLLRVSVGSMGPAVDDIGNRQHAIPVRSGARPEDDGRTDRASARQDHREPQRRTGRAIAGWIPVRAAFTIPSTPINSIADIKGLKVRVIGNPIFVDMMNALGGNGVAMGYDQVFQRAANRSSAAPGTIR